MKLKINLDECSGINHLIHLENSYITKLPRKSGARALDFYQEDWYVASNNMQGQHLNYEENKTL